MTFKGVHYDTIVDFYGFKWLIQTTDFCPVDSRIGIKIDPDGIHVMKKSQLLRHVRRLFLLLRGV